MKSTRTLAFPRKSWYLDLIDRTGRPRWDISPLWANPDALKALINNITHHFQDIDYDIIVALDALGFILGGGLAVKTRKGLVLLRKGGKLPFNKEKLVSVRIRDYDGVEKEFELVKGLVGSGTRVLPVDEWMGTGAQMRAAFQIREQVNAIVVGIAVLVVMPKQPANLELMKQYQTFAADCLVCKHIDCRCSIEGPDDTNSAPHMP